MTLVRKKIDTAEAWLQARQQQGLGASEAAAVLGISPWMTTTELWELKTGLAEKKEVNNAAVSLGKALEPALRAMYAAEHLTYQIDYRPYDLLYQSDRQWMFATLDGEILTQDGRRGILEIKTATPNSRKAWDSWAGRMPDHYYTQVVHQLASTGYDFVDLYAYLRDVTANEVIIRTYHIERDEAQADMDYLIAEEEKFWQFVQTRTMPPMKLSL